MSEELKPCPFCGGTEITLEWRLLHDGARPVHSCDNCGAQGPIGNRYDGGSRAGQDKVDAENVGKWNTRAPLSAEGWTIPPVMERK